MCRYIDPNTNQAITDTVFQRAQPFSEGLAVVQVDGLYGYVDPFGKMVIPPTFEQASDFRQGMAEVFDGKQVALIDRQGREIIRTDFRRAIPVGPNVVMAIQDDKSQVQPGSDSYFFYRTRLWRPPEDEDVPVFSRAGLFDLKTGWIDTPPMRAFRPIPGSSDSFWFQIAEPGPTWNRYDWGLMRADGSWILPPQFLDVVPFGKGQSLALVAKGKERIGHDSNFGWELGHNTSGGEGILDAGGRWLGGQTYADVGLTKKREPLVFVEGDWMSIQMDGSLNPTEETPANFLLPNHGVFGYDIKSNERAYDDDPLTCEDGAAVLFSEKSDAPEADKRWSGHPYNLRWGLKDPQGHIMVPAEHRYISCPQHGVAMVPDFDRRQWCPIGSGQTHRTGSSCQDQLWTTMIREMVYAETLSADPFENSVRFWQKDLLSTLFPELVKPTEYH
ncbi:hypothetical protein GCM10007315_18420 [Gemmobacter tilapiae]|uniref:WG repeat-containing protein n=2 Tax=Neogemmobacter tilapiae TaxID=875041 RepID=A0A918TNK7_9RHOB|nr:hypothetical protein GCM10007315_18420 [Gemmobacter tilapiae]